MSALFELVKRRPNGLLPGPLPTTLLPSHIPQLSHRRYWVAEKTDGVRCVCVAMHGSLYVFDRKLHCILSSEWSQHNLTVLDGEYVSRHHLIRIHDALCVHGTPCWSQPFLSRQRLMAPLFDHDGLLRTRDDTLLSVKYFLPLFRIKEVLHRIDRDRMYSDAFVRTPTDGLVLVEEGSNYFASDGALLKWKPPSLATVDFKIMTADITSPTVPLHLCSQGDATVRADAVLIDEFAAETLQRALTRSTDMPESLIVECAPRNGKWELRAVRSDKTRANNVRTALTTLMSCVDPVEMRDLMGAAHESQRAFNV